MYLCILTGFVAICMTGLSGTEVHLFLFTLRMQFEIQLQKARFEICLQSATIILASYLCLSDVYAYTQ